MQQLNLLPVGGTARSQFDVIELALFFSRLPHARCACVDDCRQGEAKQQAPSSSISPMGLTTTPEEQGRAPQDAAWTAPRD